MSHEDPAKAQQPSPAGEIGSEPLTKLRIWLSRPFQPFRVEDEAIVQERRSGRDRRRAASAMRRHEFYGRFLGLEALSTHVKVNPPTPVIGFTDEQRKVEVLISLHNSIRDAIQRWEDRIFQGFMLSAGAVLSAVGFYVENRKELLAHHEILAGGLLLFGLAAWLYLYSAAQAHANNGMVITRVEAVLGLCEPGMYIGEDRFFGYSGFWVADRRTPILLLIHGGIVLFSVGVIFLY